MNTDIDINKYYSSVNNINKYLIGGVDYIIKEDKYYFKTGIMLNNTKLKELPPIEIEEVNGLFHCGKSKLTSLKYAPKKVYKSFNCAFTFIKSLKYCPEYVGENIYIHENKFLNEIDYFPQFNGDMIFDECLTTSLELKNYKILYFSKAKINYQELKNNFLVKKLNNYL